MAENELPGIDWEKYHDPPTELTWSHVMHGKQFEPHIAPLVEALGRRVEARYRNDVANSYDNLGAWERYRKDPDFKLYFAARQAHFDNQPVPRNEVDEDALTGMTSARWGYSAHKAKAEQRTLDKISKVVAARPLPDNITMEHARSNRSYTGQPEITVYHTSDTDVKREIGHVHWNPENGYVYHMAMPGHPQYVPHMILKAHEMSQQADGVGPSFSDTLSSFSRRLLRNQAPEFIVRNPLD